MRHHLPAEDLVGFLSEEGVACGVCGRAWAWHCLVAMETNRARRGRARSKEGNALRPGCPLLAEACSQLQPPLGQTVHATASWTQRGPERGTDLPKVTQQYVSRPRNFHRLSSASPDAGSRPPSMAYGQRQDHHLGRESGTPVCTGSKQRHPGAAGTRWAALGNHLRVSKTPMPRPHLQKF